MCIRDSVESVHGDREDCPMGVAAELRNVYEDLSNHMMKEEHVLSLIHIYRRVSPIGSPVTLEDFMQPGNKQVAAGYIVYGLSLIHI